MIDQQGIDAFSDSGSAKDIDLTYTYGDWHTKSSYDSILSFSALFSGTAASKMEAIVELSPDNGASDRGQTPQIDSVSGGETIWSDSVNVLPVTTGTPHIFEVLVRGGYFWRLGLKRTDGSGTTQGIVVADRIVDVDEPR